MRYKFLAATFVAASLLAAPAVAYAQSDTSQKGPSASSESNYGTKTSMKHHRMRHHAHMMRHGTTTGMSTRATRPTTRKPPAS
jgi:hypothetical protein